MYNRKYSLKTRYNFDKVLTRGKTFHTTNLIIKVYKPQLGVFTKDEVKKKFGIITSNKFSKRAVVQNRAKRIIGEAIRTNIDKFPKNHYYVFVPKKNMLNGKTGKVNKDVNFAKIGSEINTFLSKMDITGPRKVKQIRD